MTFEIPPPGVRWANAVSDLIDSLVESDINYIVIQEAIERLVHYDLMESNAISLGDIEGDTIYWHPMPPLFPGMRPIHIFWTRDDDGGLTVVHIDPK